jgi:hypothetical protein
MKARAEKREAGHRILSIAQRIISLTIQANFVVTDFSFIHRLFDSSPLATGYNAVTFRRTGSSVPFEPWSLILPVPGTSM